MTVCGKVLPMQVMTSQPDPCSLFSTVLMSATGTPRARRRCLWPKVLAVRSVSSSCSSTVALTRCRPLLPRRPAWQCPPRSGSRTRATAPAWATARPGGPCPNGNLQWGAGVFFRGDSHWPTHWKDLTKTTWSFVFCFFWLLFSTVVARSLSKNRPRFNRNVLHCLTSCYNY